MGEAVERLVNVLADHAELLLAVNRFVEPSGYRYEVEDAGDGCTLVKIVSPGGVKEIVLAPESSGDEDEDEDADAMDVEDDDPSGPCPKCGGVRG